MAAKKSKRESNVLTDKEKRKIIADYVELENYSAVARRNNLSWQVVKKCVTEFDEKELRSRLESQKKENTENIIEYMAGQEGRVCTIIDNCLNALGDEEKIKGSQPSQITTAMGTLIDKMVQLSQLMDLKKGGDKRDRVEVIIDV